MSSELTKPQQVRHAIEINKLTMHSCRVTLLDAAVHAGRTTEEIGLQANWKNPGPLVLKYTRNRSAVPALMVKQLVRDLVQGERPVQEDDDTILVDANDHELSSFEFFIRNPSPGSYYEYKYHCTSSSDEGLTACNSSISLIVRRWGRRCQISTSCARHVPARGLRWRLSLDTKRRPPARRLHREVHPARLNCQ